MAYTIGEVVEEVKKMLIEEIVKKGVEKRHLGR